MSTLAIRLPSSLHRHLRKLAEREDVSMNQLIRSAVGEKLSAPDPADEAGACEGSSPNQVAADYEAESP
jgi:hypothetical protein